MQPQALCALLLLALASCETSATATLSCRILELPPLPAILRDGDTVRFADGTPVREGGLSALTRDPLDPTGRTLVAVNDRGLNVPLEGGDTGTKVFPAPAYHQKLLRLRLDRDSLHLVALDSLHLPEGGVDGLPSSRFPTGERALRCDPRSRRPDLEHPLRPSPTGLDLEGLRLGKEKGWLAEEYGPSLLEFERATGNVVRRWSPGQGLPAVYATRRPNHGLEGLALTPEGHLVGLMQSPLWNWVGKRKRTRDTRIVRMVDLDLDSGKVREFVLLSDPSREGRHVKFGDLVALDKRRFLAIEHGKRTNGSPSMDLWRLDLSLATDVSSSAPQGALFHQGRKTLEELMDSSGLAAEGIVPVAKRLLARDFGSGCGWPALKPEGLEILDDSTVAIVNDNDYGLDGSGRFPEDGIARCDTSRSARSTVLLLRVPLLR